MKFNCLTQSIEVVLFSICIIVYTRGRGRGSERKEEEEEERERRGRKRQGEVKRGRREEGGGRYIRQPSFICSADVQREWFLDSKLSSLYTITVPGLHVEVCFNLCIQSIGRGEEGKEKEENWEYKKREEGYHSHHTAVVPSLP